MDFFSSLISPWTQTSYTSDILAGLLWRTNSFGLSWICCLFGPFVILRFWSTFLPSSGPALVLLCPPETGVGENVGRSRVALSSSMDDGDSGGSTVNHCHFGVAFIRRHMLLSANMIDYTIEFIIKVSTVMDALLSALFCAMKKSMSLLLAKWTAVIPCLCWVSNISLLAIPEWQVNRMKLTKWEMLNWPCLICQTSSAEWGIPKQWLMRTGSRHCASTPTPCGRGHPEANSPFPLWLAALPQQLAVGGPLTGSPMPPLSPLRPFLPRGPCMKHRTVLLHVPAALYGSWWTSGKCGNWSLLGSLEIIKRLFITCKSEWQSQVLTLIPESPGSPWNTRDKENYHGVVI